MTHAVFTLEREKKLVENMIEFATKSIEEDQAQIAVTKERLLIYTRQLADLETALEELRFYEAST